ncbi:glycosyltransferase family 4 protein [Halorubrum sp. AD140]|uniref:glycosyltransferase family 4 protein n=1 Tax=Halorubrum sp. AD140 TaxID=3050073 RepID=UPI002ACCE69E|nr:glycosyltransferase family 4 protein [Halorubrum sp. AD140]MDZ5810228.1 glycosyltransferase family 4 protein [Halorubrum sp. AD140]
MTDSLRVLSLVTNNHAGFYRREVEGLRDRGHDVDVLAVPGYSKEVDRSVATYAAYYVRAVAAARDGYDLIHANYGLAAPPAVAQPFAPVVVSLWGSDLMGRYESVSRLCARLADEVIVMSGEMAERCGRDCRVIPHGIDLDAFRPLPRSVARSEVGWDATSRHILFPYDPDREVKDFPRAERIADRVRSDVDAPVSLHPVFNVAHERMPLYMNAADALLMTSKREGMPNTVKEALACDLPVVSTPVSDLSERLAGVSNSTVSDDDEELAAALVRILRSEARSDGREHARTFGTESQLDQIEDAYRAALGD